jgi:hypothetical protein
MNTVMKEQRQKRYGFIAINRQLETMLSANYPVLVTSEEDLQRPVYSLNTN